MKFNHLLMSLVVCLAIAGYNEKSHTIVITGQLEGVEDNAVISLYEYQGRVFNRVANDTVINGKFSFTLTDSTGMPKPMVIMSDTEGFPSTWLDIWVKPGETVNITGKDKLLRTWNVKSNLPQQKELNVYIDRVRDDLNHAQLVTIETHALIDSIKKSPASGSKYKARIDSLNSLKDSLSLRVNQTELSVLEENKTYSDIWMKKLDRHAMQLRYSKVSEATIAKMQALYDSMPEDKKSSESGESIYLSLNLPKPAGIGDNVADADMWDLNGNLQRLANFKGKYMLLDFWSSGCGPCIRSMPEMKEISETYKDRLTVVSISSDTKEMWEKTSKEKDITWVNLNDFKGDNGIKIHYGIRGIPYYVIADPDGKIVTTFMGYGKGSLKRKVKEFVK